MNLFVSNLNINVKDEDLKTMFTVHGIVATARIIIDKYSNHSRGFGYVEMPDTESANNAIKAINGVMKDGRLVKVIEAKQRPHR